MKLLIAGEIFFPDIGGPATYGQKLGEELSRRGWEVDLICYSDKPQKDDAAFRIHRIIRSRIKGWHYIKYFLKLLALARGKDLIYAQGPVSSGLPAMIAAQLLGKKMAVKVVGDYAWEQARNLNFTALDIDEFQNEKFGGFVGRLKKIETRVCRSASSVIVPSEYLKKIVSGWGIDPKKINVVYNSFELEPVSASGQGDNFRLISVGRLVPWKGFSLLIDIVAALIGEGKPLTLSIIGQGPDREKLERQIRDKGVGNKISVRALPHDKVIEQLSGSDLFILNTGYEGLSHTILEAMACGVPVITTDIGGNPELIEDRENGLLVGYNNAAELQAAIVRLYGDRELRRKFVENSKLQLNKFTFDKMVSATIGVLKKI